MSAFTPTERTQVKRLPKRGVYDRETVFKILDEAFVCHVGFVVDGSRTRFPRTLGEWGDPVPAWVGGSRMLRTLSEGIPVCVTVSIIDGLVLARSAFHHSVNYRSVVVLGTARLVEDPTEKMEALRLFTEHIMKGRWDQIRWPSEQEMKGTTVLALAMEEVSAKVRTGGPVDDAEDYELPVWAGVLPLPMTTAAPIADARLKAGIAVPENVAKYSRGGK
jgi:nitroimidazol reductase NimA-like FMN-containing flavoprotein (pyridoxamine 5'-phosphate oxidase superfamily)